MSAFGGPCCSVSRPYIMHLFCGVVCLCCVYVAVLCYTCGGLTKDSQCMCLWKCLWARMCVSVCVCRIFKLFNLLCMCVSCPFSPHPFNAHTKHTHTHTHTHSNRWLILTEIIRQQSHQHGSVVIRVWTQCLFSSRNGRSAWRKRREMHYSP